MVSRHRRFKEWVAAFVFSGLFVYLAPSCRAADFVVIAHKQVPENTLAKSELRAIFLGEKVKWENKKYIKFALLEDGDVQKVFLQRAIGKTPSQFDQHWMGMVTTGKGSMPKTFADPLQVIDYVSRQPYSIGFVPAGKETDAVKVITVK
jgi:ABC-type phosphate transport system substrate-binding protein